MQTELLSAILCVIITAVTLVLVGYIIPMLKQKIGVEKYEELLQLITVAVEYAEKVFPPEKWQEKKQMVKDYAMKQAAAVGFTEEDIDMMIESIVYEIKGA